jgi:hypothetical protein
MTKAFGYRFTAMAFNELICLAENHGNQFND